MTDIVERLRNVKPGVEIDIFALLEEAVDEIQHLRFEVKRLELDLEESDNQRYAAERDIKFLEREARDAANDLAWERQQAEEERYRW